MSFLKKEIVIISCLIISLLLSTISMLQNIQMSRFSLFLAMGFWTFGGLIIVCSTHYKDVPHQRVNIHILGLATLLGGVLCILIFI